MSANFRSWCVLGSLVPVLAGAVMARPSLAESQSDPTMPEGTVLEMLPQDAALAVMFDTRLDTWNQLQQFQLFQLAATQYDTTINPGTLPYLPAPATYEDLTAWVGPTAVVTLLPLPSPTSTPMANHMVMAVSVTDTAARDAYLQQLEDSLGAAPQRQTYQDVPLLYWPPEPEAAAAAATLRFSQVLPLTMRAAGPQDLPEIPLPIPLPAIEPAGVAMALLPNTLVAADNPTALKNFLDQRPATAPSLADQPEFQRTLAHPQRPGALATFYGDVPELLNYASSDLGGLDELLLPLPPLTPEDLQTLEAAGLDGTLEALLYPQAEGLRLQGRLYFDELALGLPSTPESPDNDRLLEAIPAPTYALASGRDLATIWQQTARFLENFSPFTREGLASARDFFTLATGLDLDQDLWGWMDGEFALFAFPSELSPLTQFSPDLHLAVGAMLQTSDRASAEATLAALTQVATDSLQLPFAQVSVNGEPVTSLGLEWGAEESLSLLSYGWGQPDVLTLASGTGAMQRLINPVPFDPLSQHSTFRAATAGFPQPNDGYFYVNAGASLLLAYSVLQVQDDPERPYEVTDYLNTLRSLSLTTATTETSLEVDGLLGLAPSRSQSPPTSR